MTIRMRRCWGIAAAAGCLVCAVAAQAQSTNLYWTGGGDGVSWDDAENWDQERVPTAADIVYLGASHDGGGNPIADAAQNIDLNIATGNVWRVILECAGAREVTLTSSVSGTLRLHETAAVHQQRPLYMPAEAAANARVDVYMDLVSKNWPQLRNDSPTAVLTIGPTDGYFDFGTGSVWRSGQGTIRLHRVSHGQTTTTGTLRLADSAGANAGTTILDTDGVAGRSLFLYNNSALQLASDAFFWSDLRPDSSGTSTIAIVDSGATNRVLHFQRNFATSLPAQTRNHVIRIIDPPEGDGSTGRLTIRLTGFDGFVAQRNTAEIVMRTGDTVELLGSADATYGWAPHDGLSGGGNLWMNRGSGTGSRLLLENAWTYTGRTMLENGTLVLTNYNDSGTVHLGALPTGTVVEIGENAAFDLNGIDAVVGGLSDYRGRSQEEVATAGEVMLGGAQLTINAQAASAFGGIIAGTGRLVKAGGETFTLGAGYTNAPGRTLRVEDGTLEITGALDVGDGVFELAGGRIRAEALEAGNVWNVTLFDADAGAMLVHVPGAGTAVITGATLDLNLDGDFSWTPDAVFTLLQAGAITGTFANFADGDTVLQDPGSDLYLRINYHGDNDSITLTVIPEPGSLSLLALAAIGLLARRRRL